MKRHFFAFSIISLACISSAFAATPVNLRHMPATLLQAGLSGQDSSMKEVGRDVDFNQATHIRYQQNYSGYPVWGADAVTHIAKNNSTRFASAKTMNGIIYKGLNKDLANTPAFVFTPAQADRALQQAINLYQNETGMKQVDDAKKNLMVYVDKNNKAHWAFLVSFMSAATDGTPAIPTYILDAKTLASYENWNDVQTLDAVQAGGFGGNPKMGKFVYDGAQGDYPALTVERNAAKNLCSMQNDGVIVMDAHRTFRIFEAPVETFKCVKQDGEHAKLYWDADQDGLNGAYSPANDALYIGQVIQDMYQKWYNIPALSKDGKAMVLKMNVHARTLFGQPLDNAMFISRNSEMYFGDGATMFYPLTSLGVGAHEISHGFTAQHSNLVYQKQSGGLNESFSDMAAQAAEFYSTGKNSWQIGPEIVKGSGALRYMDDPTKDNKSIANMKDYKDTLNVHYTSGIFNKVFYLLGSATAKGWDTRKAFDVMVQANSHYWTSSTTFAEAACGVVSATKDYKYDMTAVADAMQNVGIDISHC